MSNLVPSFRLRLGPTTLGCDSYLGKKWFLESAPLLVNNRLRAQLARLDKFKCGEGDGKQG